VHELKRVVGNDVCGRPAEDTLAGVADETDDTVGSEKQNDIRRVLDELAIIVLVLFQPFFASLAFNRLAQDIR